MLQMLTTEKHGLIYNCVGTFFGKLKMLASFVRFAYSIRPRRVHRQSNSNEFHEHIQPNKWNGNKIALHWFVRTFRHFQHIEYCRYSYFTKINSIKCFTSIKQTRHIYKCGIDGSGRQLAHTVSQTPIQIEGYREREEQEFASVAAFSIYEYFVMIPDSMR